MIIIRQRWEARIDIIIKTTWYIGFIYIIIQIRNDDFIPYSWSVVKSWMIRGYGRWNSQKRRVRIDMSLIGLLIFVRMIIYGFLIGKTINSYFHSAIFIRVDSIAFFLYISALPYDDTLSAKRRYGFRFEVWSKRNNTRNNG